MSDIFTPEMIASIGAFIAGMLAVLIVQGLNALIARIRKSGNTVDDALLPILEAVRDSLKALERK